MENAERKPYVEWTVEKLIEDAKKYETVKEWCQHSRAAYNAAQRREVLGQCCAHMKRAKRSWSNQFIENSAKKYPTRKAWFAAAPDAYRLAEERGIFEKCVAHMKLMNGRTQWSWTQEQILADAQKYTKPSVWKKNSPSAYIAAIRHGILVKCTEHMTKRVRVEWTEEMIHNDAQKFCSEVEWSKNSRKAYLAAKRFGILDKCCAHMTVRKLKMQPKAPSKTETGLMDSVEFTDKSA